MPIWSFLQRRLAQLPHRRLAWLLVLLGMAGASMTQAATYYVSLSGSDGNSCSAAQSTSTPKGTIPGGVACLSGGGDTLSIRGGSYNASHVIGYPNPVPPSGSSWGSPVTITAYPGETVVIDGGDRGINFPSDDTNAYIVIDGIQLNPGTIYLGTNSHHIRVRNCKINAATPSATNAVLGKASYVEVTDCEIYGAAGYGFYMNGHDNLFERNRVHNITGYAFHIYNSGDTTVSNNIIRNNEIYDNGLGYPLQTAGILLSSGSNNLAYNNTIRNQYNGIGILIAYTNGGTNNQAYNNTIYNVPLYGIHVGADSTGAAVKNNIVYLSGDTALFNEGTSTAVVTNFVSVNPLFVNAGSADFRLQPTSPAIGYGTNLSSVFTTDFVGSARPASGPWDAGAYQSGATVPQPAAQLAFGTQPVSTPAGDALPAMTVREENTLGALITSATDTVTLSVAGLLIPQAGLSVVSVDSEETAGYAKEYAIDGNTSTFWHTQYVAAQPPHPHQIIVNLGASYAVVGMTYRPRSDSYRTGNLLAYSVYVSTDGSTWGDAVKSGSLTDEVKVHGLTWAAKTGTYLRLVASSDVTGSVYTNASELNVLAATAVTPSGTLSHAASSGVATFTGVSISTPGTGYVLKATASGLTEGLSAPFNITGSPPTATKLGWGTQPVTTQASTTMPSITVLVQDVGGATVTSSSAMVSLVELTTGAAITGTTSVAASSGVATFTGLSLATVGTGYQFRATASGLTAADSSAFNITASAPIGTLLPARALRLVAP